MNRRLSGWCQVRVASETRTLFQKPKRVRHPKAVFCARDGACGCVVVCAGGPIRAQEQAQGTYRVAGIVVNDADGTPLGRTRVSLAEVQDRRKAETIITGADGRFEFRNVPAGKFSLEGGAAEFFAHDVSMARGIFDGDRDWSRIGNGKSGAAADSVRGDRRKNDR